MTRGAGSRFAGRLARPWRSLVRGSLTARLIASLVALVIVTCAVVGAATYTVLRNSLMTNFSQSLQAATQRQISACMNDGDGGGDGWGSQPQAHTSADIDYGPGKSPCNGQVIQGQTAGTFGAWDKDGAITEATIVSGQCHVSAADESTLKGIPVQTLPPLPKGASFTSNPPPTVPTFTRYLPSLGGDYELTAVRQPGGGPVLFTGLPLKNVEGTLRNVEIAEAAVFAIVVLLVAGTGVGLVRLSLRPLRRVAATATMVTELPLDTDVSLPARVPDDDPRTEVGQVGAAFNRMLQHVESALERRAASESRLRRFAADASHELRTPLSSIRGYAELALRHRGPVPEDVTHALHRVESESARMSVLVDELLLLARLDAGRPLEREPVDLTRLTIEATSDARVASPSHRWQLELPDEPLTVRGDELRLRQVLGNLLSNAAKHTPADSTITVAVAGMGAAGMGAAGTGAAGLPVVRLSVTDNGPGIPPELVPELFERFARGDSSRSRTAGSTGLGLAIVKAVVAAHHGSVSVQSHPGQTTFTIVLPAGDQADVQATGRVTEADGGGGRVTEADGPAAGSAGADGPLGGSAGASGPLGGSAGASGPLGGSAGASGPAASHTPHREPGLGPAAHP